VQLYQHEDEDEHVLYKLVSSWAAANIFFSSSCSGLSLNAPVRVLLETLTRTFLLIYTLKIGSFLVRLNCHFWLYILSLGETV